jgi:hypothetical protein
MGKYVESPLGKLVAGLLSGISDIKKKYSKDDNSLEYRLALKQIQELEHILKELHNSVLPKFDNQSKPFAVSFGASILKLRNSKQAFQTREYLLYAAIRDNLSSLIEKAKKTGNTSKALIELLQEPEQQAKLIEKTSSIPGKNFDVLFKDVIAAINNNLDLVEDNKLLAAKIKKQLMPKKRDEANIAAVHPMIFELAELVIRLKRSAPKELVVLAPFFNPASLPDIVNKVLPSGREIKDISSKNSPLTFELSISINGQKEPIKRPIKGQNRYETVSTIIQEQLLKVAQTFCLTNQNTPFVQKIVSQASFLQKVTSTIAGPIDTEIKEHLETSRLPFKLMETDSLDSIRLIDEEIAKLVLLQAKNQELQKKLEQITEQYSQTYSKYSKLTLDQLFKDYPSLKLEFQRSGLDTNFAKSSLPDFVLGPDDLTGKIKVIEIKDYISRLTHLLNKNDHLLQHQIEYLGHRQQEYADTWEMEQIDNLKPFKNAIFELQKENQELQSNENGVDILNEIIEKKKLLPLRLSELQAKIIEYREKVKQTKSPSDRLKFDLTFFGPEAEQLLMVIESITEQNSEETIALEKRLRIAQEKAQFEQETLSQEVMSYQIKIDGAISIVEENMVAIKASLSESKQEIQRKRNELNDIEAQYKKQQTTIIIPELLIKIQQIQQYRSLATKIPEEQQLFENNETTPILINLIKDLEVQLGSTHEQAIGPRKISDLDLIKLLTDIEKLCLSDKWKKGGKIPFSMIDDLVLPLGIIAQAKSFLSKDRKGFDYLLEFLDIQNQTVPQDKIGKVLSWKKYREKQDKLLGTKPNEDKYKKQLALLIAAIQKAKLAAEIRVNLTQAKVLTNPEDLINKLKLTNPSYNKETQLLMQLEDKLLADELKYQQQSTNHNTLVNEREALKSIQEINLQIKSYKADIGVFGDAVFTLTEPNLYQEIFALEQTRKKIDSQVQKLKETAQNIESVQPYVSTLSTLFEKANERLKQDIISKINTKQLENKFTKIASEVQNIIKLPDRPEVGVDIDSLSSTLTKFHIQVKSIKEQNNLFERFASAATQVAENEDVQTAVKAIQAHADKIHYQCSEASQLLMSNLALALQQLKNEADGLKIKADLDPRVLTLMKEKFAKLLDNKVLDEINNQFPIERLNDIKQLRADVTCRLQQLTAVSDLLEQIEIEKSALPPKYAGSFDRLKSEINDYKQSDDSNNLLSFTESMSAQLMGTIKSQTIFHKITAEILDIDQKMSAKDIAMLDDETLHQDALVLLTTHSNRPYVGAIQNLYVQIQTMSEKWKDTIVLAGQLRRNLDEFVVKNSLGFYCSHQLS